MNLTAKQLKGLKPDELSDRELHILKQQAQDATDRTIAAELGISPKTVEYHSLRARRRIGCEAFGRFMRYAVGHGWVSAITSLMLLISAFQLFSISAFALELRWNPPASGQPQGYVLTHWAQNALVEQYGVGNKTNLIYHGTLVDGLNYFAVSDYEVINGELMMSTFSNIAIVTNTPALDLQTVIFSTITLKSELSNSQTTWLPWHTNHLIIYPTDPERFFRTGEARLVGTNIVTVPLSDGVEAIPTWVRPRSTASP